MYNMLYNIILLEFSIFFLVIYDSMTCDYDMHNRSWHHTNPKSKIKKIGERKIKMRNKIKKLSLLSLFLTVCLFASI